MIIHLKSGVAEEKATAMADELSAFSITKDDAHVLITSSGIRELEAKYDELVDKTFVFDNDMQLASRAYLPDTREITIGNSKIGGSLGNTMVIAGLCSVESEEQITSSAELMV